MNRQKFNEILELLQLNKDDYQNGKIKKVSVNEQEDSWTIFMEFSDPIKIESIEALSTGLKNHFTAQGINKVEVNYSFKNKSLSKELMENYYNYFLNIAIESSPRYSGLKAYITDIEDNDIKVYVGSNIEVEFVDKLLANIEILYHKLGFSPNLSSSISPFQTSKEQEIEQGLQRTAMSAIEEQKLFDLRNKESEKERKIIKRKQRKKHEISGEITALKDIPKNDIELIEYRQKYSNTEFVIEGTVINFNIKTPKTFKIYEAVIFDGEDSILVNTFINDRNGDEEFYRENCGLGKRVRIFGYAEYESVFSKDVMLRIKEIVGIEGEEDKKKRHDNEEIKRVELHAHTKMSTMDGVVDIKEYMELLKSLGHQTLAITDHNNIQAFPDFAIEAKRNGIKPIYGLEASFIDEASFKIALTDADLVLKEQTFVIYDLETTGLSSIYDDIIEIAAVKLQGGMIVDEFSTFVKPKRRISEKITEITSIKEDDVRGAPTIDIVIKDFSKFIAGSVLVAHNASFDNSHLYRNLKDNNLFIEEYPTIDTMQLARVFYNENLKMFNLKALAKFFDVELTQHHRAIHDARATASIFMKMLHDFELKGILNYSNINKQINPLEAFRFSIPNHLSILVKNKEGLKNLYKIVSDSHTTHFHREALVMKSVLDKHRNGLLIGSGCNNGIVFDTAFRKSFDELLEVVSYFDYLEVQPYSHYLHKIDSGDEEFDTKVAKETIEKIILAGKQKGIPVVATGDVHILEKEDLKYREIFINVPQVGGGIHPLFRVTKLPVQNYLTTKEMLDEFNFLEDSVKNEIVVTNSNKIANEIETFDLFPEKLFAPKDDFMKDLGVPSFKDAVSNLTYSKAKSLYGNNLPKYVDDRIKKELNSIIGNNYASIYYISHLLVKNSKEAGYVVGSRGSVGSSVVAFFMDITEVNSLVPHYYCPECHYSAFKFNKSEAELYGTSDIPKELKDELDSVGCGFDLASKSCPNCGSDLCKDGIDIPFETFLGFDGKKVPDIDLNFSGEYQAKAHEFCRELFGEDNAFRAGTISTIQEKTAFGYVKGYLERKEISARKAEINRLASKITGVKRSTGQHPGGIVVIPKEIEYSDITPVQYPADDLASAWRTTHYDYHKFEDNLLKLDILGHDDPTMIRYLMNFVEMYPNEFPFKTVEDIPISDPKVLSIFSGLSALEVDAPEVMQVVGTSGIPEFGTQLTKEMLREINPKTIDDLIKISGLSHGTNVWNGNARDYMLGKKPGIEPVPFKDLIGCRDDIMVYLISRGMEASDAFAIMESVRRGRGVEVKLEKKMLEKNVPKWYIDSCKAIEYMFPKAHATAYVIMALRIAWFKVYKPIYYYAAFFSRRAIAFDVEVMVKGKQAIKLKVKELEEVVRRRDAKPKDNDLYNALLLALEMTARGFKFSQVDIFKSDAKDFIIEDNSLRIPFSAIDSLGIATANSITDARKEGIFTSVRDVLNRTRINTTLYEKLNQLGVFGNLPVDDQIGLFKN